jgi:hypothetical protein
MSRPPDRTTQCAPWRLTRREALRSGVALSVGLPALTRIQSVVPAGIVTIGHAPQLFADLARVDKLDRVSQQFHSVRKHPANPVLRKLKPWETLYGTWGSVIFDEQENIFKAWYGATGRPTGHTRPGFQQTRHILCYATSSDGVHWDRPELGLHEVDGSKKNNAVVGDEHHEGMAHWESVLKDAAEPDPQRRYKAMGWSSYDWDGPLSGIYSMTSPDGLHWTHTPEPLFRFHPRPGTNDMGPVGDAQSLMIDPLRGRYVAYLRTLPDRAMSESTDFVHWSPLRTSIQARADESSNMVYNHCGFVYGDQYLGFLTYFNRDPVNPLCTVRLLASRNGDTWERPTDAPLIDVGDVGEPDRFLNMLTGAPPIRVGDELFIYFRSLAVRHGPYEGRDNTDRKFPGGISLATIRVDGFASLNASYDGGTVTSKPLRFRGENLRVNVKADFGQLLTEVLDDRENPIVGFTRQDCNRITADSVDQLVTWQSHNDLRELKDRVIRLRFFLENVRLYSYRIA